jgi:hypothetical protein
MFKVIDIAIKKNLWQNKINFKDRKQIVNPLIWTILNRKGKLTFKRLFATNEYDTTKSLQISLEIKPQSGHKYRAQQTHSSAHPWRVKNYCRREKKIFDFLLLFSSSLFFIYPRMSNNKSETGMGMRVFANATRVYLNVGT